MRTPQSDKPGRDERDHLHRADTTARERHDHEECAPLSTAAARSGRAVGYKVERRFVMLEIAAGTPDGSPCCASQLD